MVDIFPRHRLFAARQGEAAGDERAGVEIEFADRRRILAAIGQGDQAPSLIGLKAGCAMPHPTLSLGFPECVDVENRRPLRRGRPIAGQCCLPPDTAEMGRVLPEVENRTVNERRHRNAVFCPADRQRRIVVCGIARIGFEHASAVGVAGVDPCHRPWRVNAFEPEIGVGRRRGGSCRGRDHHRDADFLDHVSLSFVPSLGSLRIANTVGYP